jgi:signal peptidase I
MYKKTAKKIGSILFYIFASFLTMFIMLELFLPSKTIDILGFKGYVVVSPSMEPYINVNDIVIVTKIDEENLEIGQVITFYTYLPTNQEDSLGQTIYVKSTVTHYLADIVEDGNQTILKTKDYNKFHNGGSFDTWYDISGDPIDITTSDLIGKVSFKIPLIGIIITFSMVLVRNPIFLGLVILNVTIFIFLIKYIKKSKENPNDLGRPDSK